jgi:ribosomal protein L35AE/L33A
MFEALERRVRRRTAVRVEGQVGAIEARLRSELPGSVDVVGEAGRVVLIGRGLRRRFVTDPALRWLGLIR